MLSLEEFNLQSTIAAKTINGIVLKTPLLKSTWLSKLTGCNVYLKMESEQLTRSFKLRGAANKISKEMKKGTKKVITASTGNHGTACLYVGSKLGIEVSVYAPLTIYKAKEDSILQCPNGELVKCGNDAVETEYFARKAAEDQNVPYISPYNDIDVMLGQSTLGYELMEQLPDLDAVFISVGGGGLAAGSFAYLKSVKPDIITVGCQPEQNCGMYKCIEAGYVLEDFSFLNDTLADGVAGGIEMGSITFGYCQKFIDKWVLTSEEEIEEAVFNMLDKEKKLVEGAAGLPIASLIKMKDELQGKNVVLLICGGNIDTSKVKDLCDKFSSWELLTFKLSYDLFYSYFLQHTKQIVLFFLYLERALIAHNFIIQILQQSCTFLCFLFF